MAPAHAEVGGLHPPAVEADDDGGVVDLAKGPASLVGHAHEPLCLRCLVPLGACATKPSVSEILTQVSGRKALASGVFCANAKYNAVQCAPWASLAKQVRSAVIEEDLECGAGRCTNYWFYACTNLARADGMAVLAGVEQM